MADDKLSLFIYGVILIIKNIGKWVIKDSASFIKTNLMIFKI